MPTHIYKNSLSYSKNNALQYNFAVKMLKKIPFKSSSRALDIGSGDGLITHEIAKIIKEEPVISTDTISSHYYLKMYFFKLLNHM